MIFLNELNSSFKQGMFFFLIFSLICIEYANGNDGAGSSRGSRRIEGRNKHVQEATQATLGPFDGLSPDVQKQYEIRIYTRLCNLLIFNIQKSKNILKYSLSRI